LEHTALVLAGGNALGAFEAGAYRMLSDEGVCPEWIVGSSIGAVNGAIIAGNPVEHRNEALRSFWSDAALPGLGWPGALTPAADAAQRLPGQMQAMLFGTPAVFVPNYRGMIARQPSEIGLYDLSPLRPSLGNHVDFDLLNRGDVRLTVVAIDLESGEEVLFDTRTDRIGPEHIIASCALLPEFRPVEIGRRLLGDGGLVANLPLDVVRREPDEGRVCIAIDLFDGEGRPPATLGEAAVRRQELMFASQSRWFLEAYRREDEIRSRLRAVLDLIPDELRERPEVKTAVSEAYRPVMPLIRLAWRPGYEIGIRPFDYSERAVAVRWTAGERTAAEALRAFSEGREARGENATIEVVRGDGDGRPPMAAE
jgi:NTE family protein